MRTALKRAEILSAWRGSWLGLGRAGGVVPALLRGRA